MHRVKYLFLFLMLLTCAYSTKASIAVVQKNQGFTGIATSIDVAYTSNLTAGTVRVAFAYVNLSDAPATLISDTLACSWTSVRTGFGSSFDNTAAAWMCYDTTSGADTVHISSSGTNLLQAQIYELSGFSALPSLFTGFTTTTSSSPSATTAGSAGIGDFVLVEAWNAGNFTFTAGTGYSLQQAQCGSFSFCTGGETATVVSAGPVTGTFNMGGSTTWGTYVFVFQLPASSSSGETQIIKHRESNGKHKRIVRT